MGRVVWLDLQLDILDGNIILKLKEQPPTRWVDQM